MTQTIDSCLASKSTSFHEIPVVDLAPLLDGSDVTSVARQIGNICENVGFLYVKNHGVPSSLVEDVYRLSRDFFMQPFEVKNRLNIVKSGPTLRGYIPMYGENVDPKNTKDFKECFDYAQSEAHTSPFFGPNLMPESPEAFSKVLERYHEEMLKLARKLISAIAISLDLPADYFEKLQKKPITIQRLLHYPPQFGKITSKEIGIGAHTDYGFLTILSQDENGGLQVQNRDGDWVSAPPVPNTFIVNIGDLVQTFTNDRYLSTMHRVINTSGVDRYSVPFFIDLDFDAVVDVVPTCIHDSAARKYAPYTSGAHKFKRFVDSYTHLQEAVAGA